MNSTTAILSPIPEVPTNNQNTPTQAGKKLYKLEAVRGFAAVYVALGHTFVNKLSFAGHNFSFILKFGQEAVILFFLLSGFVIQYSYTLSKDKSFKTFFFKRFLRVYIPLIAFFLLNYLFFSLENHGLIDISPTNLICNLGMFQDASFLKPNVLCDCFLGNQPLWSLSYEWWFYMLFFALINIAKKHTSRATYSISILAAITYLVYPNFFNRELMYLAIWWAGADMATLYLKGTSFSLGSLKVQLAALLVITIILASNTIINKNATATIGMSPFLELRHFAFSLLAIIFAVIWKKMNWVGFNQTVGLFTFIAPISFGIYISHWFLIANAHYLDEIITNQYLRYTVYTIVCVFFAYIVERVLYIHLNRWIMNKVNPKKVSKQ